jgi:hypothetical protein
LILQHWGHDGGERLTNNTQFAQSIHTVSSYEDVVSEADSESSYETVDEISEPSEYEIEEVEVSDYVTDSDASVENPLGKREKKGKARSKGKKNRKKGRGKKSKKPGVAGDKEPKAPTSPLKKLFSFRPKKKNDKDETATKEAPAGKPKGGKIGKATKSKNAANNADDSDPEKEEEKEEEEEEEDEQDEGTLAPELLETRDHDAFLANCIPPAVPIQKTKMIMRMRICRNRNRRMRKMLNRQSRKSIPGTTVKTSLKITIHTNQSSA